MMVLSEFVVSFRFFGFGLCCEGGSIRSLAPA